MPGSSVIRLNATTRLLHFPMVLPFSREIEDGSFEAIGYDLYTAVGSFLAVKHVNERSSALLPNLPELFRDCDIQLSTEIFDSQYSPVLGSRYIAALLDRKNHSVEAPYPAAIIGGLFSTEAKPAAVLTGIYGVPFISGSATSSELENRDKYPTFARVIPTDAGNAYIIVEHFASLGVREFGVLYVRNEFGVNYERDLVCEAKKRHMQIKSVWYETVGDSLKPGSAAAAMEELRKSNLNYFFGIPYLEPNVEIEFMREASRAGLTGPGFTWFLSDARLDELEFGRDDQEMIDAINGLGILVLNPKVPPSAEPTLMNFQFDTRMQEEFIESVKNVDDEFFVNYNLTKEEPIFSYWVALAYDSVLLPVFAACSIDKEFFSAEELFQAISLSDFQGATGRIRLSNDTQTRDPMSIQFAVMNAVIAEGTSDDGKVRFERRTTELVRFDEAGHGDILNDFIYSDNSTNPPLPMPPLEVNLNLINNGSRISGLALCALVILIALGWMVFTYLHRRAKYIRGSQPPFLYMLCIGVIVMTASIIPMSLQEPIPISTLNVSCMSQLWLLSAGFTTAFSALFCKIWRLNKVVRSSMRFRRMKVRIKDVLYPFAILLSLNFILLTVWTVVDPLLWVRTDDVHYTTSGQSSRSTGSCASSSRKNEIVFYTFLCLFNFVGLGCANWQSYKARNLKTEFNESSNITMSMLFMTEAALLGLPVLFLVGDDPSAFFLVRSVLITIISLGVLMPIFVPKVALRNKKTLDVTRVMTSSHLQERRNSSASWWGASSDFGSVDEASLDNFSSQPSPGTPAWFPRRVRLSGTSQSLRTPTVAAMSSVPRSNRNSESS